MPRKINRLMDTANTWWTNSHTQRMNTDGTPHKWKTAPWLPSLLRFCTWHQTHVENETMNTNHSLVADRFHWGGQKLKSRIPRYLPPSPLGDSILWTPDSRLRTPDSGLPIEKRSLQEIIINNHKPKSFSSSVEHPHKDSAWFTKSENHQCEASPQHSVASLLDNFP